MSEGPAFTYDAALEAAKALAATYETQLGQCIFSDCSGTPANPAWTLLFDILGGPSDWCWHVYVDKIGECSRFVALHHRPPVGAKSRTEWIDRRPSWLRDRLASLGCAMAAIAVVGLPVAITLWIASLFR